MLHYLGVLMQWFNGASRTPSSSVNARVGPTYTATASVGPTSAASAQVAATLRPAVIILPL